jgi:hypothetical protein
VKLTTQLQLVTRLRICGIIPLLPLFADKEDFVEITGRFSTAESSVASA